MSRPSAPGSHLLESWPLSPVRWLDTQHGITNCAWAVSAVAGLVGALDRWGGRRDVSNLLMRDRPPAILTLACQGTTTDPMQPDAKPQEITMGVVINFSVRTVAGFTYPGLEDFRS